MAVLFVFMSCFSIQSMFRKAELFFHIWTALGCIHIWLPTCALHLGCGFVTLKMQPHCCASAPGHCLSVLVALIVMYCSEWLYFIISCLQGSVLGCQKPVLGRTVPKIRFKPAFYCPKLSKTAPNRPKLSETAN